MPAAPDLAALFALPPEEAIAFFRSKGYTISWNWWDTWKEAHAKAFTVAKVARLDILQDIRGAVDQALAEGKTERWFQQTLGSVLQRKGWWGRKVVVGADGAAQVVREGSPRRLETIFRTNLQTAYAAGRWKAFQDNAAARPYAQYVAVMDSRTRPAHAALNGRVFRLTDPVLEVIAPPNGWGCRCRLRALSEADLRTRGLKVETDATIVTQPIPGRQLADRQSGEVDPAKLVRRGVSVPGAGGQRVTLWTDPGWDYNVGTAGLRALDDLAIARLNALPQPVAALAVRELVAGPGFARFMAQPDGRFPLVSLPSEDAQLVGARTRTAVLSDTTMRKQLAEHPELTAAEYARAQDVVEGFTARAQDGPNNIVYVLELEDGSVGGYVLVIKATRTGNALFVTSYRRLPRSEALKEGEIARLLRRQKK